MASELSRIDNVLFDLDGTLSDNRPGITGCIIHALSALGRPAPPAEQLLWCIGPPLRSSFSRLLALSDQGLLSLSAAELANFVYQGPPPGLPVEEAVLHYRSRYDEWGWSQNSLFAGVAELFSLLHDSGRRLVVTTTKAQIFAERIVGHFSLSPYLTGTYGPSLDGRMSSKTELVAHAIERHGLIPEKTVIVGDRALDIVGGKANGITTVGVSYGFGSLDELRSAGADYIAGSVVELMDLF